MVREHWWKRPWSPLHLRGDLLSTILHHFLSLLPTSPLLMFISQPFLLLFGVTYSKQTYSNSLYVLFHSSTTYKTRVQPD